MEFASGRLPVTAPGVVDDPLLAPEAIIHFATPGYFETLGIPLRRGRDVRVGDDATAPFVAVISESLGERLWPGEDPIGRRLFVARAERTVVGVAADIAVRTLEGPTDAQIYFPAEQLGTTSTYYAPKDLVVRSSGDPLALAPALRRIVREADPAQAVTVRLLEDIVAGQTRPRRDQLRVLGSFAAVAFFLAAVGVHGLLSFTVSTRTRELGVRVALGAARGRILRTFVGHGVALGVAGIALGMPLAYVAARGMTALLFGVEPDDPAIYGSAAALAVAMTLAGSLRPALRAARVDPALTIRSE
jgi:putative ABC transport system permease protein